VIAVVDYGIGNLGSVMKALRHVGAQAELTGDRARLARADALVLPGDGAFAAAMGELEARGLVPVLRAHVAAGKPLLGICIGMQLLFEASEEHGTHAGLGLLPGRVTRFAPELTVPHMGWNALQQRAPHPLLDGVDEAEHVYFVHSYRVAADGPHVMASADYGGAFAAVVARENVMGVQFHPEKSQAVGLRIVANFAGASA
jgi:glutamine amidotransferase